MQKPKRKERYRNRRKRNEKRRTEISSGDAPGSVDGVVAAGTKTVIPSVRARVQRRLYPMCFLLHPCSHLHLDPCLVFLVFGHTLTQAIESHTVARQRQAARSAGQTRLCMNCSHWIQLEVCAYICTCFPETCACDPETCALQVKYVHCNSKTCAL